MNCQVEQEWPGDHKRKEAAKQPLEAFHVPVRCLLRLGAAVCAAGQHVSLRRPTLAATAASALLEMHALFESVIVAESAPATAVWLSACSQIVPEADAIAHIWAPVKVALQSRVHVLCPHEHRHLLKAVGIDHVPSSLLP